MGYASWVVCNKEQHCWDPYLPHQPEFTVFQNPCFAFSNEGEGDETELASTSPQKKPLRVLLRTAVMSPRIIYPVPPIFPPRESTVLRVKSEEHHGSQSFWRCEHLMLFNFVLLTFPEVMSSLGQGCIISEFDGTSKIMLLCFPPYGVLPSKNFLKVGHLALAWFLESSSVCSADI